MERTYNLALTKTQVGFLRKHMDYLDSDEQHPIELVKFYLKLVNFSEKVYAREADLEAVERQLAE